MKKKGLLIVMTVAAMTVLSACGTEVPNLSEFDNDKAAEYMAGAVLKYDSEYTYALKYDHSILNATPVPSPTVAPVPTAEPAGGDEVSGQTGNSATTDTGEQPELQQVSLSDVFGIGDVELEYVSASLKKSYGKGYESIVASEGKKLLIIYFQVKNSSGDSKKVDLSECELNFALHQNDRSIPPLRTAAKGDLQYFDAKIGAGKSEQGILMFEVDAKAKLAENSLLVTGGTKQATITLP